MEPGHEDREYLRGSPRPPAKGLASMEPGHEDREYTEPGLVRSVRLLPQWSPVMKTGNTGSQALKDTE